MIPAPYISLALTGPGIAKKARPVQGYQKYQSKRKEDSPKHNLSGQQVKKRTLT